MPTIAPPAPIPMLAVPSAPPRPAAPPDDPTIWRVDDALWAELAPLLRVETPPEHGGRPRHPDRPLLDGILWVLRTGARWAALPREFGAKSARHDRFQAWVASGAFARAWAVLLGLYDDLVGLELAWHAADGCLTKAPLGKKGARRAAGHGQQPDRPGQGGHQAPPANQRAGRAERHAHPLGEEARQLPRLPPARCHPHRPPHGPPRPPGFRIGT